MKYVTYWQWWWWRLILQLKIPQMTLLQNTVGFVGKSTYWRVPGAELGLQPSMQSTSCLLEKVCWHVEELDFKTAVFNWTQQCSITSKPTSEIEDCCAIIPPLALHQKYVGIQTCWTCCFDRFWVITWWSCETPSNLHLKINLFNYCSIFCISY